MGHSSFRPPHTCTSTHGPEIAMSKTHAQRRFTGNHAHRQLTPWHDHYRPHAPLPSTAKHYKPPNRAQAHPAAHGDTTVWLPYLPFPPSPGCPWPCRCSPNNYKLPACKKSGVRWVNSEQLSHFRLHAAGDLMGTAPISMSTAPSRCTKANALAGQPECMGNL